ncbi:MAG: hypothetical protein H0X27_01510 [Caulobacteraceae bacterium]|nr:hypothetical protein [Caulobacteraceae bacterium]
MIVRPAYACALALLPAPAAAASDPAQTFAAFAAVCADTRVDYPAVAAAADAGKWKPTEVRAATMEGVAVTDKISRDAKAGGADLTLFAWRGMKGAIQVSACTVRVGRSKAADLRERAQAWAGFAPQDADAKKATFRFTDDAGARKPLAKADYDAAAAGAGMEILTISADGQDAILDLLKIKK